MMTILLLFIVVPLYLFARGPKETPESTPEATPKAVLSELAVHIIHCPS
jgi:hypothetical protein